MAHVPSCSPHSVAEHAIALILASNRQIPRAYNRVRDGNFSIDGLIGFDLNGKTAGLVGGGRIGRCVARILHGFGCRMLVSDPQFSHDRDGDNFARCSLDDLLAASDIVSLHCPLTSGTRHLINGNSIGRMKRGVMLINTSRGALIESTAVIDGLLSGQIGHLGLDVYEGEAELFHEDRSNHLLADRVFARLLTFPNVVITGHQAFFTVEALSTIARVTVESISAFASRQPCAFALNPLPAETASAL